MGRLRKVKPEETSGEVREIFEKYLQDRGNIPNAFRTLAQVPELLTTLIHHYRTVMFHWKVSYRLKELIFLKVSQVNDCHY